MMLENFFANDWENNLKIPKNKDNRTELEKEYDSLTTTDKIASGFVRNNFKNEILNFDGFEDAILDNEGDLVRQSDQDWYSSLNSKEQSAIIIDIKDGDTNLSRAYEIGRQKAENISTTARRKRVKCTSVVFNNKDIKKGNIDSLDDDMQEYFRELNNSGKLVTVYKKKHGKYKNIYDSKNDWFTTINNISESKNFSQVSLGFGSNERRGHAVDVDDPENPKDIRDSIYSGIYRVQRMLGDDNYFPSYISINTLKNTFQVTDLYSEEDGIRVDDQFENLGLDSIDYHSFITDCKIAYHWVRHLIESCYYGFDPGYVGYLVKCFKYTHNHIHLDSNYKDINKNYHGKYIPVIKKRSFFKYFLPRLFKYAQQNGLDIPLAVYRLLGIEEEYSAEDIKEMEKVEYNLSHDIPLTSENKKSLQNFAISSMYNSKNYIKLTWQGSINTHPYYSHIESNLKDICKLISELSFEEALDRFLTYTKYPINALDYLKEGRIIRNTPAFIDSGVYQNELHKDRLLSLDDSIIGIHVRESLMRAYEWYFIGFGSNYSNIEDSTDIHSSAVGGWASTSDYAREEIKNQINEFGNSLSYYSWNKGIRPSANGSKYTVEQRIRGNETVQFNSNIGRINTKLEFHDKKFTEVKGSSRYKSDVKKQDTEDLIKNIFLYEGSEFIYNFSNRKNNEYIKNKLYELYINKNNILTLVNLENIDISDYEPYLQILDNLYEPKESVEESNNIVIDVTDREYSTSYLDTISIFKNRNYISLDSQNKSLTGNDFYKNLILANLKPYSLQLSDITYYYKTIDKFKQNQEIYSEAA